MVVNKMDRDMNILYRDTRMESLIDMFSQEYRDILDEQEPLSQSALIGDCNNAINRLNTIKNHIKLTNLLDNLDKKYGSNKISGDVIKILEEIRLNDIDLDKIKELLNAP